MSVPISTADKVRSYNEGEQAAFFGGRREENPYQRGTEEYVAWDGGFMRIERGTEYV